MNKARAQKKHALHRFYERYRRKLTENEYQWLIGGVNKSRDKVIKRISNRVTVRTATLDNTQIFFLYDNIRRTIITFLTEEQAQNTSKE